MNSSSSQQRKRPIRDLQRTLNIQGGAIPLGVNPTEVKDVADRKFLQETSFEEDINLDDENLPERRGRDQVWRQAAKLNPPPVRPIPEND